jgi:hypothetical protein
MRRAQAERRRRARGPRWAEEVGIQLASRLLIYTDFRDAGVFARQEAAKDAAALPNS